MLSDKQSEYCFIQWRSQPKKLGGGQNV